MGYCQVSDVQANFKAVTFGDDSLVTYLAVSQFIDEASSLIDSYVGQRWVTPITADASSVMLMSLFCQTLVADRVRGILANKQQTNTDANQQVKSDGYSVKDVMKALNDIKNGDMTLRGAQLLLDSAGFYSNNAASSVQPRFTKNTRQW